ncbi:MAG: hypothetical protein ACI9T7_002792 [Oleiphilaceae bacterium]|jgi:hypothetical protein
MSDVVIWSGIFAGLVIISGLCWFIFTKLRDLKAFQTQRAQKEAQEAEKRNYLKDSIRVIATTMLEDQVELSEGCIRIKVLIDHFDVSLHEQESLKIFEQMYRDTKHMPTHEARKNTDKNFIHKLDQQRFALEKKHRESIRNAAKELLKILV